MITQSTEHLRKDAPSVEFEKGEASRPKRPQEPQPPFPYRSEEVTVRNERDGINLAGTLTLPEKGTKFPAVVMVTEAVRRTGMRKSWDTNLSLSSPII